jgi:DNA-directed RNA polymerase subunit RPC12/RpoP
MAKQVYQLCIGCGRQFRGAYMTLVCKHCRKA